MNDFISLRILDLFRPLFEKIGVDYNKMRLILNVKLLMDSRKGESGKNPYNKTLLFYCLIGFFCSRIVFMQVDLMPKMIMIFAFLFIMLLTCFISDFSSVLLDISDKYILGVTATDLKTISTAKISYIFIYVFGISTAIAGPSLVMFLIVYNSIRFCLLFAISIVLIDFLLITIVSICYYVLIKLFKGDKLKDILNIFQLFMLAVFFIAYYAINMGFNTSEMAFTYNVDIWSLFNPFSWFAALFYVAFKIDRDVIYIVLSLLAIIVPIFSICIYMKLAPVFEANLEKLEMAFYNKPKSKKKFNIGSIICRDIQERALFEFIGTNSNRDKDFKTKMYYNLMLSALMPIAILFTGYTGHSGGILEYLASLENSKLFLCIYLVGITFQANIFLFSYSKEFEASFIYDVLPIDDYSKIYKAQLKVIIAKLLTPIMIFLGLIYVAIFKLAVIKHIVVIFISMILITLFTFKINDKKLPFSEEYVITSNSANFLKTLKSMIFVGMFTLIHYLVIAKLEEVFIYVYALLLLVVLVIFWKFILNIKRA